MIALNKYLTDQSSQITLTILHVYNNNNSQARIYT